MFFFLSPVLLFSHPTVSFSMKSYKTTSESFGQTDKLKDSYASVIYQEQLDRVAQSNTSRVSSQSTVFIQSKQDVRDHRAAIEALNDAANEKMQDLVDDEELELTDDENDPELALIKAKRMAEMQKEYAKTQEQRKKGHGDYVEVTQDEFLANVTKSTFTVCAFYHADFERCKIVDKHMSILAQKHFETKFIRVDAAKCPFFIEKLAIKMLPCVICFIDGKAVDRIVGFEDFGGNDNFTTSQFLKRLWQSGVIENETGVFYKAKNAPLKTLLDAF